MSERIPLNELTIVAEDITWLDKHVEVWYNCHYTRPARIVKELGNTLNELINVQYENLDQRDYAKTYVQKKLSEKIMNRSHLEDNLARLENDKAMTCDPKRCEEINKSISALKKLNAKEILRRGFK